MTEMTMVHYASDGWLVNRHTEEGQRLAKASHSETASSSALPSAEVPCSWCRQTHMTQLPSRLPHVAQNACITSLSNSAVLRPMQVQPACVCMDLGADWLSGAEFNGGPKIATLWQQHCC